MPWPPALRPPGDVRRAGPLVWSSHIGKPRLCVVRREQPGSQGQEPSEVGGQTTLHRARRTARGHQMNNI